MITENLVNNKTTFYANLSHKLSDYIQLGKLRLSLVVVFSAGMSFLIASLSPTDWWRFVALIFGGLFISLSANAINEILESGIDAKMKRTSTRPLPSGRMNKKEAVWFSVLLGLLGVLLLTFSTNILSGFIGLTSLLLYGFAYTPLKKSGSVAVIVGGIPGALPVVIGWTAARGELGVEALILFSLQFIWQLPHFWAIAWVSFEDYLKAGYKLLPFGWLPGRNSAIIICISTFLLIPLSYLPYYYNLIGLISFLMIFGASILFFLQTILLVVKPSRKHALQIMFGSFIYLPVLLISMLIGKI